MWWLLCLEQLLFNSFSLDEFLKTEGIESGMWGTLIPFVRTGGQSWGWEIRVLPRHDPTHCQAVMIITILKFEMHSGCFSKYEDIK